MENIQPRYKRYLRINKNPKNWEYVCWILEMGATYRKSINANIDHSIAFDNGFDLFMENQVKAI